MHITSTMCINIMKKTLFFRRASAHIIDICMIIVIIQMPLSFFVDNSPLAETTNLFVKSLTEFFLLVLTAFFWIKYKGTPGKLFLKLSVISATGEVMTWQQSVVRYFAYLVSLLPLGAGFLWSLFDEQGRCWHDMLSKTKVVYDG